MDNLRDLDLACREYFLGADIDLASITIGAVVAMLPPIAFLDFTYYGFSEEFLWTSVFEVGLAAFSLLIILTIRRQRAVLIYERAILVWNAVMAVVFLILGVEQPARLVENTLFSILVLLAMYVTLPNRYAFTVIPAASLSLGGIAILAALPSPVSLQNKYIFTLTLLMLNFAGAVVVARSNRFKRREYYSQRNERVARQMYETLSQIDPLTGLLNRRSFLEHAQQALNRYQRYQSPFCLVIFDLDYFKRVNDTYGHLVGDEALRRFAGVLKTEKRVTDEAGRLGGEEFGLLLAETHRTTAQGVTARIQEAVRHMRLPAMGEDYQITFSAGVGEVQPSDQSLDDLIRRTDQALYQAKDLGRDRIEAD
jgi:diguanylate cyclase (GGDEF)-like protein